MRNKYPFLERYEGDWPIKEYLKKHLTNKWHYNCSGRPAHTTGKGGDNESFINLAAQI
jgi:hypothetical protein